MSCQKKERLLIFNLILRKGNGKLEIDSKREGYSSHNITTTTHISDLSLNPQIPPDCTLSFLFFSLEGAGIKSRHSLPSIVYSVW
ncbi:unnamed protein product, partial [Vitis vinifera]